MSKQIEQYYRDAGELDKAELQRISNEHVARIRSREYRNGSVKIEGISQFVQKKISDIVQYLASWRR